MEKPRNKSSIVAASPEIELQLREKCAMIFKTNEIGGAEYAVDY